MEAVVCQTKQVPPKSARDTSKNGIKSVDKIYIWQLLKFAKYSSLLIFDLTCMVASYVKMKGYSIDQI